MLSLLTKQFLKNNNYILFTLNLPLSPQSSQGGGHRTLLYGHAILLKHTHSSMVGTFTILYL